MCFQCLLQVQIDQFPYSPTGTIAFLIIQLTGVMMPVFVPMGAGKTVMQMP